MELYTLQSYFKSLCNSFYIAYAEKKRLEEKLKEADLTNEKKTLKEVEKVLEIMKDSESTAHRYICFECTEQELKKEKEKFEETILKKSNRFFEMESERREWAERLGILESMLWKDLVKISRSYQKIIVTSKKEVYAIMYVYAKEATVLRVLNIEEQYLIDFPKDDKLCSSFLTIYLDGDKEKMIKFCKENI